jgi:predicted nucleotidyltransferase component of viral defense system
MMIANNKQDSVHKAWLYRLLINIFDNDFLSSVLRFKGGTCAAMLGYLDRFSVDLDFDFLGTKKEVEKTKKELRKIFSELDLEIKDESKNVPQFFLRYKSPLRERSIIKIDTTFPVPKNNVYEPQFFVDIQRNIICQNIETMFANKLVAVLDRYEKNNTIAARDIYDIDVFFLAGHSYNEEVIKERTGKTVLSFFSELHFFIDEKLTDKIINQDLNSLISYEKFKAIRKILKREVLFLIRGEIEKIKQKNTSVK